MPKHNHPHTHNHELDSKNYYDHIAKNFNHTWDGFLSSFFKKFITKNLEISPNAKVLDIGCANGTLLDMLSHKVPLQGTGLDISPEMTKIAKQLHPEFEFISGTAQNLPFPEQSYDVMICSASFHHFPDPAHFLKETKRVLREDGRLVIAEIRIPIYDIRNFYNRHIEKNSTEGDVKVYGQKELLDLFSHAGFEVIQHKNALQIQYYELKKRH